MPCANMRVEQHGHSQDHGCLRYRRCCTHCKLTPLCGGGTCHYPVRLNREPYPMTWVSLSAYAAQLLAARNAVKPQAYTLSTVINRLFDRVLLQTHRQHVLSLGLAETEVASTQRPAKGARGTVLLLALLMLIEAQCKNFTVQINTGQAFVTFIRGINDTDAEDEDPPAYYVYMGPNVTVSKNVTVPPFPQTGSMRSGSIALMAAGGKAQQSIFSVDWRKGVMPALTEKGRLHLSDIILLHSCFTLLAPWTMSTHGSFSNLLNPDLGSHPEDLTDGSYSLLTNDTELPKFDLVQRTTCLRLTMYTLQSEIWAYAYMEVLMETPFQELYPFRDVFLNNFPLRKVTVAAISPHMMEYDSVVSRVLNCRGFAMRSTTNPNDPLNLSEQAGTLEKPRICLSAQEGGRQLTAAETAPRLPFWIADSSTLGQRLGELAAYNVRMRGRVGVSMGGMMVTSNATLALASSSSSPARPTELGGAVTLVGPFRHKPDWVPVSLSFGNSTSPLIQLLNSTAHFLVRNLVLEGLAAAPLPSADATAQPTTSALPMWALGMPARDQALRTMAATSISSAGSSNSSAPAIIPQLILNSCTLVLPQADYAALLAAALRQAAAVAAADAAGKVGDTVRDAWAQGATQTAAVLAGISVFQLEAWQLDPGALNRTAPSLEVAAYIGWGVNATQLVLVPEAPLGPDFPIPDLAIGSRIEEPAKSTSSKGGRSHRDVALGVGIGVGGGLLLLLAGTAIFLKCRRQCSSQEEGPSLSPRTSAKDPAFCKDSLSSPKVRSSNPSKSSDGKEGQRGRPRALEQSQAEGLMLLTALLNSRGQPRLAFPLSHCSTGHRTEASAQSMGTAAAALEQAAKTLNTLDPAKLMLKGILGKGAWGVVYKGEWKGLTVAVKTLAFTSSSHCSHDPQAPTIPYNRAVSEAAVCTSLLHPNIATTYKFDIKPIAAKQEPGQYLEVQHVVELGEVAAATEEEEGGAGAQGQEQAANKAQPFRPRSGSVHYQDYKLYLVQEYCHCSLYTAYTSGLFHDPNTRWPFYDRLLSILVGVGSGLQFLHSKNIIHGDLKPANVMLKGDDDAPCGMVAKLIDFGLAMALDPTATHVSNFSSGTPFYVAPEVLTQRQLTKASDIYSLGLIMWETYCGCIPLFRVKGQAVDVDAPLPPFPDGTPPPYLELTHSCLAQDPKARPSAEEVASRLQAMLDALLGVQQPAVDTQAA